MIPDTQTPKFKESQALIVQNLSIIDTLANEENPTPEVVDQLVKLYNETILWIDDNFSQLETNIIYQLLEFLNHYSEVF